MYLITSLLTKAAFIDEKRNAYIFTNKEDAKTFTENVQCTDSECLPDEDDLSSAVFSQCYAAGALVLKKRTGNGMETEYRLSEEKLEKRFYNGQLNADITRYMHTHNSAYLADLKNCSFIVPVRITNTPYTKIDHAVIYKEKEGKPKYTFIAFSDLVEYDKWTEKDNGWKPLLIDRTVMKQIGRKHGFLLDVYRTRFYITPKTIAKFISEGTEE